MTIDGVPDHRLPAAVEATAYFITAEALTNVSKYAQAPTASVTLAEDRGRLRDRRSPTTGSAAPTPRSAPACAASTTASPRSTAASWSPRPLGGGTAVVAELPLERQ